MLIKGFPGVSIGKESPAMQKTWIGWIPGLGRSPGEGNGTLLQYSCLENPWTGESGGQQSKGVAKSKELDTRVTKPPE